MGQSKVGNFSISGYVKLTSLIKVIETSIPTTPSSGILSIKKI